MTKKIELKGSSFTLSVLHLLDDNLTDAMQVVAEKVNQAPSFFDGAPVVIDISKLQTVPDFEQLKTTIEQAGMLVVGIAGCKDEESRKQAKEARLAVMTAAKPPKETAQLSPPASTTKVITAPVRSGQQIYAKNGDLIVLNHVSAGAEIIADGNIHIYGVLRGRAIAGACGQEDAYIFCHNLQSELISIAGTYWLSEAIPQQYTARPVKVSLKNDSLNIEYLTL